MLTRALAIAEKAVADRAFPGGQIAVFLNGENAHAAFGHTSWEAGAPVDGATLYDVASVTKIAVTASLAMITVASGKLRLTDRAGDFVHGIADDRLARATVEQLLTHSSGLPAWKPLFRGVPARDVATPAGRARMLELLKKAALEYPPGEGAIYSDLDMMLLGHILETIFESTLDRLARERVFVPLEIDELVFRPADEHPDAVCAPTEHCRWRGRILTGVVDDENTYAAGGVLGQAGLFATARALARLGEAYLAARKGEGVLFDPDIAARFTSRAFPDTERSFCLGFDGKSPRGSRLPDGVGPKAFGHWGFTGAGLWIDPDRDAVVALLTNRVHPTRDNDRINHWRPRIIDAAVAGA
ncbi:beta-lactamase family protein [bacterium]|nr:beta-lactamase family protein [bacterium]